MLRKHEFIVPKVSKIMGNKVYSVFRVLELKLTIILASDQPAFVEPPQLPCEETPVHLQVLHPPLSHPRSGH